MIYFLLVSQAEGFVHWSEYSNQEKRTTSPTLGSGIDVGTVKDVVFD